MHRLPLPRTSDIDFCEALDQMGGDGDLLKEVIDIFFETAPDQFQEMEDALDDEDMSRLQTVAHGLKGSAASIGAIGFSTIARELEAQARTGEGDNPRVILVRLRESLKELAAACSMIRWEDLAALDT